MHEAYMSHAAKVAAMLVRKFPTASSVQLKGGDPISPPPHLAVVTCGGRKQKDTPCMRPPHAKVLLRAIRAQHSF